VRIDAMASGRAESDTPMPTTETAPDGATSTVTDEEWKAMADVLTNVYAYRTEE
jgi:chromatin structure-remodeling complex subunit RSC1/2